jgi:glutamate/tyrosine decarboxylase-like PLP-dependent enzyme
MEHWHTMTFDHESLPLLGELLRSLEEGFTPLPDFQPRCDLGSLREALLAAAERMRNNYPYHHPLYIGQMLKPPHAVARLAYALAMFLNPNNHALDGSGATSPLEKEAVAEIARMFGWETHLGHLCGGGTMANFEALWIARELRPGKGVAASEQAHYTHSRLSSVLGVPFHSVPVDSHGRMDVAALEALLEGGGVGTVVATLGTTAAGAVDSLEDILTLTDDHDVRLHVDTAYGGYFTLVDNLGPSARRSFDLIGEADSIVVDPHKHGLQPYGCGCVIFRDPDVGRFYRHDSPYTYFTSDELHLGEISLECSRAGASALALWTTMRLLPLARGGQFARGLELCRESALRLHDFLERDSRFAPLFLPELDIVVWAVRSESASQSSALARKLFAAAAERDLHLALASFPRSMLSAPAPVSRWDAAEILCLRACAMKPEHAEWMPQVLARLEEAAEVVLGRPW